MLSRWAGFAAVYRENADDVVLRPKRGLPMQPEPDEEVGRGRW